MKKFINILLVDDHPIILDAYKNSINQFLKTNNSFDFNIDTAICFDSALSLINDKEKPYDLVFLDIRLPESKDGKLKSGEDLGSKLIAKYPNIKIIVITGHYDAFKLGYILQDLNHMDCFLKEMLV